MIEYLLEFGIDVYLGNRLLISGRAQAVGGTTRNEMESAFSSGLYSRENNVNERIGDDSDLVEWVSGGAIAQDAAIAAAGSVV